MRRIDALLGRKSAESRYSFSDWISEAMKFQGQSYPLGYQTTYGTQKAEGISADFTGFISGGLKSNAAVFALERIRVSVFSEARFTWRSLRNGRPGDMFSTPELGLLERPWVGGTTGDLLSRMLLDADLAGNSYVVKMGGELVRLRPDWVRILLSDRVDDDGNVVGQVCEAYLYHEGGPNVTKVPAVFLPHEVAHFAPMPDPSASYMGMSWLTPVIREIQADTQATKHKLKFFENAATPNLAISMKSEPTPEQFKEYVSLMEASHAGADNAYKTLYTAGGADITVIGANMQQMDFGSVQGKGEIRLANAAGVPPVLVGFAESLAGSSLNAGNYGSAKRQYADDTLRNLWRNVAGSLEILFNVPASSQLWYDDRDVAFLREDEKDSAEIQSMKAVTIRQLVDAGYKPETVVSAVEAEDMSLLQHSGLFSIQLQEPLSGAAPTPAP